MEPVPLQNCIDQLESLEYNPIIGNKTLSQSRIKSKSFSQLPTRSNLIKPKLYSAASAANSLSPRRVTPRNKRTFSETCTSPSEMSGTEETENLAKQPKSISRPTGRRHMRKMKSIELNSVNSLTDYLKLSKQSGKV